jgi:DNA-binding winged helix-turn-helix (wHTH) protein/tetratricopeptide (TPR) repeat protein
MRRSKATIREVELDLGRYELRRAGHRIKIEKKPMELLILLARRREQMVSREEIVKRLWRSDLFIDAEANVNNVVRKLRTALGDNADKPRFLETVVGKGYRFIGPVRVVEARVSSAVEKETPHAHLTAGGERSSLAVLPLLLLGKAADDEGLCLGFADALIARLGNLAGVDVLPTAAALTLPADSSATKVASQLGVRFVVRGAIQMSKGQWRLSLEMFDAHAERSCFTKKCDVQLDQVSVLVADVARRIAGALNRPGPAIVEQTPRYSRDPLAYAEFVRGYRITALSDASRLDEASQHLTNAVTRDPGFALAHATLSLACATRHFEFDPASMWLEKAEFHCRRALEIDANLPEGYVARAFLLWGPSKNFQHLEAIADLKRALALQNNLPHAYNRLGTILAHIGLLDYSREMFERGRPFQPRKAVSPSVVQVYVWAQQYDLARERIQQWRAESPGNRYPIYFAPLIAMMTEDWREAERSMEEALRLVPHDPVVISLQGVLHALLGRTEAAAECVTKACAIPKSFGHAHHTYYQIACTLALIGECETAFEWLERSVSTGFACWPFFLHDPCLARLRNLAQFDLLINALQAKYPEHLGLT